MLGSIFPRRRKTQELRAPTLQEIKRFRDAYAKLAERRHIEVPPAFEKSVYRAISCQKELHALDLRGQDLTDPQLVTLAEALLEWPMLSSIDLRDNRRLTDDGAKALLEVLRLQILAAKTPPKMDAKTRKLVPPPAAPEYARYVTSVLVKGLALSPPVIADIAQYTDILQREDKRLEIRAALHQIDHDATSDAAAMDEDDCRAVLKLLTGAEPSRKESRHLLSQCMWSDDCTENALALENVLLAKCSSSPPKNAACPPWEALVQVRHAVLLGSAHSGTSSFTMGSNDCTGVIGALSPRAMAMAASSIAPSGISDVPIVQSPRTASITERLQLAAMGRDAGGISSTSSSSPVVVPPVRPLPPATPTPTPTSPQSTAAAGTTGKLVSAAALVMAAPAVRDVEPVESLHAADHAHPVGMPPGQEDGGNGDENADGDHADQVQDPVQDRADIAALADLASWKDGDVFTDDEGTSSQSCEDENENDRELIAAEDRAPCSAQESLPDQDQDELDAAARQLEQDCELALGECSPMPVTAPGQTRSTASASSSPLTSSSSPADRIARSSPKLTPLTAPPPAPMAMGSAPASRSPLPPPPSMLLSETEMETEPETDQLDEQVLVEDVYRDGKPRAIVQLVQRGWATGLRLSQALPSEVSASSVVVLVLAHNNLSDLQLFSDTRWPSLLVLDLSSNRLAKLADEPLAVCPKLQVLDLADNGIKRMQGFAKLPMLRALNLRGNAIKTVVNVEHLTQLEVLHLGANNITAIAALRVLSLNQRLAHLNLDGNAVLDTDARQRRKITVHILNILPALQTLGAVAVTTHAKPKLKTATTETKQPPAHPLLESEAFQGLWVAEACRLLQLHRDAEVARSRDHDDDDDPYGQRDSAMTSSWGNPSASGSSQRTGKPSRGEQQQRDELRSKAVAYRSRAKAPPSPIRKRASPYAFGPPLPPPQRSPRKSKPKADPAVVRQQKARAIELSAPRHAPVDTAMLAQHKRQRSRPTFDVNMSVAERLQLAQDKAQQQQQRGASRTRERAAGSASTGASAASQPCPPEEDSMGTSEPDPTPDADPDAVHRPAMSGSGNGVAGSPDRKGGAYSPARSPGRRSDIGDGMAATTARAACSESSFLRSLAVSDFLAHADEECSTALTALTVLLSMSERPAADTSHKLLEYRRSLDALDILDDHESRALFEQARQHEDPSQVSKCTAAFDKLGVVKNAIKTLLTQLDQHEPGSAAIQAFCRALRTNELRGILPTSNETPAASNQAPSTTPTPAAMPTTTQSSTAHVKTPEKASPPRTRSPISLDQSDQHHVDSDDLDFLTSSDSLFADSPVAAAAETAAPTAFAAPAQEPKAADSPLPFLDKREQEPMKAQEEQVVLEEEHVSDEENIFETDDQALASAASSPAKQEAVRDTISWNDPAPAEEQTDQEQTDIVVPATATVNEDQADDFLMEQTAATQDGDGTEDWLQEAEQPSDAAIASPIAQEEAPYDGVDSEELEDTQQQQIETGGMEDSAEVDANAAVDDEQSQQQDEVDYDQADQGEQGYEQEQEQEQAPMDADASAEADPDPDPTLQVDAGDDCDVAEVVEEGDVDDEEAEVFGDWEKGFDPNTNHYFWFNHETGESQWTAPDGWPYPLDSPFEDADGEGFDDQAQQDPNESGEGADDQQQDEEQAEEQVEDADAEAVVTASYREESAIRSSACDDLFSDDDLPGL